MIKKYYQKILVIFVLAIIALPIILPYFHKGYFPTHDGEWAVVRLGDMFRSLRDQQFPVRYSGYLNFGYGYPLFNFVYPAPYYIGIIFHFLKFSFVDTIKTLFSLSVILSSIAMYFASKEIWGNKAAGFISALFYIYFPYRIVDLYARGSIGESLSFALFPIILFYSVKILNNEKFKFYIILGSISYALLIMTHNIMAVLFTPILLIFIVYKMYVLKIKRYFNIFLFIILSYGLSAFFWIPALLEKKYIILSKIPIANRDSYFVNMSQLIVPKWGYGLPDHPDGFSYQIGLAHIAVFLISISLLLYFYIKKRTFKSIHLQLAALFGIIVVLLILLMFPFTKVVWESLPLLKEINYPWTLLAPIGFLLSLLSGFLWTQNKFIKYIVLSLCVLTVFLTLPHARPEFYIDKGDYYYLTNDATTTSSQELMPVWVKQKPEERPSSEVQLVSGHANINVAKKKSTETVFLVNAQISSKIAINTIYFPGWNIYDNGKSIPISYNNPKGVMEILLPKGVHKVQARFTETNLRLFSDLISIMSLLFLLSLVKFKYS